MSETSKRRQQRTCSASAAPSDRLKAAWSSPGPPEHVDLREQARGSRSAVDRFGRHADSWINGYSKEFARELAAHGWIGMSWPTSVGGGGRPPIDRLIVGEELIAAGAPIGAMWFADRQMGPTLINYGRPDQQAAFLPAMLAGETTWCIGMSEPDSGSDLAGLQTGRVRDGDEWVINGQKIWTSFGDRGRLLLPDLSHPSATDRRTPASARSSCRWTRPGIEVRPITDLTGSRALLRGVLRRRARSVREPRRRRRRGLQADDAPARARTRRDRPAGVEPGALRVGARRGRSRRPGRAATDRRTSRRATASVGSSCCARCSVRRPKGFSAATKCFCTEHEIEVADFVAAVLGMEAMLWDRARPGHRLRAGVHDHGRHLEHPAQHPRRARPRPPPLVQGRRGRTRAVRRGVIRCTSRGCP